MQWHVEVDVGLLRRVLDSVLFPVKTRAEIRANKRGFCFFLMLEAGGEQEQLLSCVRSWLLRVENCRPCCALHVSVSDYMVSLSIDPQEGWGLPRCLTGIRALEHSPNLT